MIDSIMKKAASPMARRWFLRDCGVGIGRMALAGLMVQLTLQRVRGGRPIQTARPLSLLSCCGL